MATSRVVISIIKQLAKARAASKLAKAAKAAKVARGAGHKRPARVHDILTGKKWTRPEHLVTERLKFERHPPTLRDLSSPVERRREQIRKRLDVLSSRAEKEGLGPYETTEYHKLRDEIWNLYFLGNK